MIINKPFPPPPPVKKAVKIPPQPIKTGKEIEAKFPKKAVKIPPKSIKTGNEIEAKFPRQPTKEPRVTSQPTPTRGIPPTYKSLVEGARQTTNTTVENIGRVAGAAAGAAVNVLGHVQHAESEFTAPVRYDIIDNYWQALNGYNYFFGLGQYNRPAFAPYRPPIVPNKSPPSPYVEQPYVDQRNYNMPLRVGLPNPSFQLSSYADPYRPAPLPQPRPTKLSPPGAKEVQVPLHWRP